MPDWSQIAHLLGDRQGITAEAGTSDQPAPCGHPHTWFDRTLCAEPCGMMHTCCTSCGMTLDVCAWQ